MKQRQEIPQQDRWNVEIFYPDIETWEEEFIELSREGQSLKWPELASYKGKLDEGPEALKIMLDHLFSIGCRLEALYTYAHLRHDEDITNDRHKIAFDKARALIKDFGQETAWFEPELLALSESTHQAYLSSPLLSHCSFYLEMILRLKKHLLSEEGESLMAMASKTMETPHKAFSAINDADFKFGSIVDGKGQQKEISHALYGIYIRDQDRLLRENAFKRVHGRYQEYENTLCELITGQIQNHYFNAKVRHYQSCLEAALYPKNIDTEVYYALIQAVNEEMGALHKYINLRQQVMGVDQLHLYDMYVPLIKEYEMKISYKEAEEIIIESVAPLGVEYQNLLRKGLLEQRWVDRYENLNKRSGAYSSGSYDSMPYILMNYKELLRDVFTLAHEVGHSMHSLYSNRHQPYHYCRYPIYLAEVASTFNEELLMHYLLGRAESKEEKIVLLNQKIEDIRGTLFRQTMFAEFELHLHECVENGMPLTPKLLKEEYRKLNAKYFGPSVVIDSEGEIEWARIPHFYYNFYVFQYATGISAALALSDKVVGGTEVDRDAYLSFLKSGCSRYPIDTLQFAGVDMRTTQPVKGAIAKFTSLVDQLAELLLRT